MTQKAACLTDQPAAITLGTVVSWSGDYGVVWHASRDTLRVLPLMRSRGAVALSLANEVALHLPLSLGGWGVAHDELAAWPRAACGVAGEIDERCLLKLLDARRQPKRTQLIGGRWPATSDQLSPAFSDSHRWPVVDPIASRVPESSTVSA
jgi:hypothetical protein